PVRNVPRGDVAGTIMSAEADRRSAHSSDGRWDGEIPQIPRESATIADGALRSQLETLAHSHGSPPRLRRMQKAAEAEARDRAGPSCAGRCDGRLPQLTRRPAAIADGARRSQLGPLAHSHGSPPRMRRMQKAAEAEARDAAVLMLFGRGGQARTEAGRAENRR